MGAHLSQIKTISDILFTHAVIIATHNNRFVFVKHKDRITWELPGGKLEKNETILECAKRELVEETGALSFTITPLFYFRNDYNREIGLCCYANIVTLAETPDISEISKIKFCNKIPRKLTYPEVTEYLFSMLKNDNIFSQKPD